MHGHIGLVAVKNKGSKVKLWGVATNLKGVRGENSTCSHICSTQVVLYNTPGFDVYSTPHLYMLEVGVLSNTPFLTVYQAPPLQGRSLVRG